MSCFFGSEALASLDVCFRGCAWLKPHFRFGVLLLIEINDNYYHY